MKEIRRHYRENLMNFGRVLSQFCRICLSDFEKISMQILAYFGGNSKNFWGYFKEIREEL